MNRRTFLSTLGATSLGAVFGAGRVHARDQVPTPDLLVGTWEGTVLFVNGWRARARVELAATPQGGAEGTYELTMLDEEGPGEPRRGGVLVEPDGAVRLASSAAPMRWRGTLASAAPHAETAFHGSFTGPVGDRGVFMLFRYRR